MTKLSLVLCKALFITASLAFISATSDSRAQQPPVKIVGIGAATCETFVREAVATPQVQRDYLAWMQGYMSGIMIGRPAGLDEGIDLAPKSFPLRQQLDFVRAYCLQSPAASFADAIEALYKRLRTESGI